uniref:Uncharacterized protein n=1 Tax=Opuntia streptacantha TaxID=393608 RepID=A0A7C8YZW1_OPUST
MTFNADESFQHLQLIPLKAGSVMVLIKIRTELAVLLFYILHLTFRRYDVKSTPMISLKNKKNLFKPTKISLEKPPFAVMKEEGNHIKSQKNSALPYDFLCR